MLLQHYLNRCVYHASKKFIIKNALWPILGSIATHQLQHVMSQTRSLFSNNQHLDQQTVGIRYINIKIKEVGFVRLNDVLLNTLRQKV